jgi:hypothetical protein
MPTDAHTPKPASGKSFRRWLSLFYLLPVLFVVGLCGLMAYQRATHQPPPVRKISAEPLATVKVGGLEARLFAQGDALRALGSDVFIEFRDAHGKLTDVGDVQFELMLKMPAAILRSTGIVMRTATPGQYRATLDPNMAGQWAATLRYSGSLGKAEAGFNVKVL